MSILAMTKVYQSGLEKSMKAIALAYADHAHDDGTHIYPTVGYTAWKTGYGRRSVQTITAKLVDCGVLIPEGEAANGANMYRMDFDKLPERKPYRGAKFAPPKQKEAKRGAEFAPIGAQNLHGQGAGVAPKPSYNQNNNHQNGKEEKEQDPNLDLTWTMLLEFCDGNKEIAKTMWQLQEAYSEKACIPRPDIDSEHGRNELLKFWWPTLKAVLTACDGDLAKSIAAFEQGVAKQSDWKPDSVSAPSSVRTKTMAVIGAWKRGADLNGNGKTNGAKGNGRQPTWRVSSSTQAAINVAKMIKQQKQRMANNE